MNNFSIYIASKTQHAPKWLALREQGYKIISTWIDEAEQGATPDFQDLANRCIQEPSEADITILYCEEQDHLKYALAEVGAALACGKPVIVVGKGPSISSTMLKHPLVTTAESMDEALSFVG